MAAYDQVLTALADPTRRTVFERLRARPSDVEGLAATLPVSRPAVSQHLRVLADAGLVTAEARGTRRIYRIRPDGLDALRRYLDTLWDDVLTAYGADAVVAEGDDATAKVEGGREDDPA